MFYKLQRRIVYLAVCCLLLSGCTKEGSVSLEEALRTHEEGTQIQEAVQTEPEAEAQVYVYICGAVETPGVYALKAGSRIIAAVEAAGGFLPEAAEESVNLAEPVQDGMQIVIPTIDEAETAAEDAAKKKAGIVNLNTASAEELCSLSGIGASKAEAILAYRAEIGAFQSIEQLMEVSGIGENLFNRIRNSIYIE